MSHAFGAKLGMCKVFRVKEDSFVDLDATYEQLEIREDEVLILTENLEIELVRALTKEIVKAPENIVSNEGNLSKKHTVILVHGIRTHADWYQRAKEVFSSVKGLEVEPIKYGRFDLIRFLVPGPWRRGPIEKTERKILPILKKCESEGRSVTIIAHSNGTHVIAEILKKNHIFKFDNLIMCGSIVDTNYDWHAISHKISGKIINDYGVRDVWPALAQSITWGYGYSGTNGFGAPVIDRLHNTPHSAYFDIKFMRPYWESFFKSGDVVNPAYGDGPIPKSPWWFFLFEIPWKWIFVAVIMLIILSAIAPTKINSWFWMPSNASNSSGGAIEYPEGAGEIKNSIGDEGVISTDKLFAYYEIGRDLRPSDEDGRLTIKGMTGSLPLFENVKDGTYLMALSTKNLHFEPTSNSPAHILSAGACVRVIRGPRVAQQPANAMSGGWLPVERAKCPFEGETENIAVPKGLKPRSNPPPENICNKLPTLDEREWPQTQISEQSFIQAIVKSGSPYIKITDYADLTSDVICEVSPNTSVRAVEVGGGWAQVRLSTGHLGYIKTKWLEYAEDTAQNSD